MFVVANTAIRDGDGSSTTTATLSKAHAYGYISPLGRIQIIA